MKVELAGLLLVCVSLLVIRGARKFPFLVVGWFWYLGTLIPVIGLVQVGAQAMADRYTYVPLIGLSIMIAWGVPDVLAGWRYRRVALSVAVGLSLLLMMLVTQLQVRHWQNSITLFEHSLDVTSDNSLIHNYLGVALAEQGKIEEAMAHYAEALRIKPDFAGAHYNLGFALAEQGKIEEAMAHYAEALRIKPDYAEVHNNLGAALAKEGKIEEAMVHYAEALRIKPDYAEAHNNLGAAFAEQGKIQEAIGQYAEALRIKPDFAEAHYNLGLTFAKQGKIQEAMDQYQEALRVNPNSAEACNNLAWFLATAKTPRLRDGRKALELSLKAYRLVGGENPQVLETLAAAYARVGAFDHAVKLQERVLESPQYSKDNDAQQRLSFYRQGLAWPND